MRVQSDSLTWEVNPGDHDQLGPCHEEEITPLVLSLLPAGGVFLDIGAHVGHYALRAARKASRVIALEPNPDTAARLRENIALNSITNVDVAELAAWDGTARFSLKKVHDCYVRDGSNYLVPDPAGTVWGARLDDILSKYPLRPDRLDLVKIDAEGSDLHVISGMDDLLTRFRPVLFIEDHSLYGYYARADLFGLLDYFSYGREPVSEGSWWIARPEPVPSALSAPA
jgi:FkbM family methyltransferase